MSHVKSYTTLTVAFHRICSDLCRKLVALGRTMSRSPLGCRSESYKCRRVAFLEFGCTRAVSAHMPRPQERAQITTCTVVGCGGDLGPVCGRHFISQHELAGDTKASITAKMKLESSLLHICLVRVHERPTRSGSLSVDQCTLIGSEGRKDLHRHFDIHRNVPRLVCDLCTSVNICRAYVPLLFFIPTSMRVSSRQVENDFHAPALEKQGAFILHGVSRSRSRPSRPSSLGQNEAACSFVLCRKTL